MHLPRLESLRAAAVAAALLAPLAALALGLGAASGSVPLGQPLDFNIPLRVEPDEVLSTDCVQADVLVGERAVPAVAQLRSTSPTSAMLRVTTKLVVDEPVVTVQIAAGCRARVSRRYVVFADPGSPPPAATALPATPPAALLSAPALPPADVVTGTPAGAAALSASGLEAAPSRTSPLATGDRSGGPARASARAGDRGARRAAPRAAERRVAAAPSRERKTPPRRAASRAAERVAAEPRARLMLEPAEAEPAKPASVAVEEALTAVAQAASQARAAAAAASVAAGRIAELERHVENARAQTREQQAEAEQLRAQLREAASPWWSWVLFGLSVLLALVAAWMAWRMRGMQQAQEMAWTRVTGLPAARGHAEGMASVQPTPDAPQRETSPLPLITSELTQPATLQRAEMTSLPATPSAPAPAAGPVPRGLPADDEPEPAMQRTLVLPPSARVNGIEGMTPREVSIEELIDVDQQAEFFLAIGQDHAAIELLVAHLRNTGGGSPLTYLKLLDIYRHLGDQEDYERTRSRFNHRFNAYAPEWGADLQAGRSLEDYEGVVPRLQAAWGRPLDAMAELEALLFRKSRGELFELPAYRDVLFLYALARDLQERESQRSGADVGNVDLLLPLNLDFADDVAPRVGDSRATTDVPLDEHPTAPLDLDLTPIIAPQSIFSDVPVTRPPWHDKL